ncbi:excinuclease ABC, C subunit [Thermocrinis albus DSM 14484]|uniref:UvrABC system protein C n=1 Tax=Thermocrinis albus (strain DSM 14484 / JCM 11386 / HI 11/12) TaxID=638303 RepID=D3SNT5_THEAH|nr:excinuclease ABC subunit UvrC [Thermocrinis albus]ADC88822.1 excinuclease ABC, C subunit [Thermocrinis albus DSM 14484]
MIDLETLKRAPESCGVYLFQRKGRPIYIGKAKNIKERLLQHYRASTSDPREKAILEQADSVDWFITRNEFEALTLEIDLIQTHKPKYNILHKYGAGYPMLLITEDPFPTLRVVRGAHHRGKLFGPFFTASKAYKVKRLVHSLFKLRTCDPMPIRKEPCMDYHLGLCSGPCCGKIDREDYLLSVMSAESMLSGEVGEVLPLLYQRIDQLMVNMEFEKCAVIRDQIQALERLGQGQKVSPLPYASADVFYRMGNVVGIFLIRSHKLVDKQIHTLESESQLEEMLAGFYYANVLPQVLLVNFPISEELIQWLQKRGACKILPLEDPELEKLLRENVGAAVPYQVLREEFLKTLSVPLPEVIEGFDVSHFYGEYVVGSCVVWEKGFMNKKRYRRYRIKSFEGINDYMALEEILSRRARRLKEGEEKMPDIWLIDGGVGQLNVGIRVRDRWDLPIKVMALAKEEELLITEDGRKIPLKENPLLYKVFGLIRDEAHRFALSYNRQLRLKNALTDILDKVKGIGEVKKRIIYRNFDNLYEFLQADPNYLKQLGIDPSLKQEVEKYLAGDKGS